MTVPLEKLQLAGSIEFEMVYHVGRMNFETINMIQSDTRQHIGTAKFTAAARRQARAAASNAPQAATAAGGAARVKNHKKAAAAGNRGRSITATRVGAGAAGASAWQRGAQPARNKSQKRPAAAFAHTFKTAAAGRVPVSFEVAQRSLNNVAA